MEKKYRPIINLGKSDTDYRLVDEFDYKKYLKVERFGNQEMLLIDKDLLTLLAKTANYEINHFLRSQHLSLVANILTDKEASANDHYVATELLKNANIASGGTFPMCQDTGTAIIYGYKGDHVLVSNSADKEALTEGVYQAYQEHNLRFSQLSPISMFEEVNTKNNLPAQIEIYQGDEVSSYNLIFIAKGGGSANKSFLYQTSPAILDRKRLIEFLTKEMIKIGTTACPPYHLSVVIGGTSAEYCLKIAKLSTTKALDHLPKKGGKFGQAFRDLEFEKTLLEITRTIKIGAQFGGKYFCLDTRVIRLPRHAASLPIAIAVSCSADRQIFAKIDKSGVYLEKLEKNPAKYLPSITSYKSSDKSIQIDLNKGIDNILSSLDKCKIKDRLSLNGTIIVARDLAHLRWRQMLNEGKKLPNYCLDYPIYYAAPAKTPKGYKSGSFGPTTAGRMDEYIPILQEKGASLVTLAKGNRSKIVCESCEKHGGFYLGSIGGPAARYGRDFINSVEVLDFKDLDMEAVWKINVVNFPAFLIIDNKGNDFFKMLY